MSLLSRPYAGVPELDRLQLVRKLGCGHEGCVYTTERGTVVKVSEVRHGKNVAWGANMAEAELLAARALLWLQGHFPNSIIPTIYRVGRVELPSGAQVIYIEREGLNDLQLSDEGEAMFTDDVGRVLGGASSKMVTRFPDFVPLDDQRKLKAVVRGYLWLKGKGLELEDHNAEENWGVRADGTIALRDLGHIWLSEQLRAKVEES